MSVRRILGVGVKPVGRAAARFQKRVELVRAWARVGLDVRFKAGIGMALVVKLLVVLLP